MELDLVTWQEDPTDFMDLNSVWLLVYPLTQQHARSEPRNSDKGNTEEKFSTSKNSYAAKLKGS